MTTFATLPSRAAYTWSKRMQLLDGQGWCSLGVGVAGMKIGTGLQSSHTFASSRLPVALQYSAGLVNRLRSRAWVDSMVDEHSYKRRGKVRVVHSG